MVLFDPDLNGRLGLSNVDLITHSQGTGRKETSDHPRLKACSFGVMFGLRPAGVEGWFNKS